MTDRCDNCGRFIKLRETGKPGGWTFVCTKCGVDAPLMDEGVIE